MTTPPNPTLTKQVLEELLRQACQNVGHKGAVELPTDVAQEFAALAIAHNDSLLRTAASVVDVPLGLLLAMGAIDGPPNAVADLTRGRALLRDALSLAGEPKAAATTTSAPSRPGRS